MGSDSPPDALTRRFLNAISRMEKALRARHQEASSEPGLGGILRQIQQKNKVVNTYSRELREFAELRNTIVHNPYVDDVPIATPLQQTVVRVEAIAHQIESPATVSQALKGSPPIHLVGRSDYLHALMPEMLRKDYSQLVVYDDGQPATLLTTNTIARWVASRLEENGEGVILAATLEEVLEFAEEEGVQAVKPGTPVADVVAYFASEVPPRAVLITSSGKREAQPVGILVSSDLPRLNRLLGM